MEGRPHTGHRKRSYTPGAPVETPRQPVKRKKPTRSEAAAPARRRAGPICANEGALHDLIAGHVAETLARHRMPRAVVLLSMVNKSFRQRIDGDFEIWYRLYVQWKGPYRSTTAGPVKTARGSLLLYPTVPRSLPNFRDIFQSHTKILEHHKALMELDKGSASKCAGPRSERETRLLQMYKKIICLQYIDRCGLCGTTRHITKPYWHIGMRLCKYCLQDNLVSDIVLEERYFIRVFMPVALQDGLSFSQIVAGKVWYFKEHCASRQRTEFSADYLDSHPAFGKTPRPTWLFWRPHLDKVLDIRAIEEDAVKKRAAAAVIRAQARRALTLRTLGAKPSHTAKERLKKPTYTVAWGGDEQDLRPALFALRRMRTPQDCQIIRCLPRWNNVCIHKIADYEDRLLDPPPIP